MMKVSYKATKVIVRKLHKYNPKRSVVKTEKMIKQKLVQLLVSYCYKFPQDMDFSGA